MYMPKTDSKGYSDRYFFEIDYYFMKYIVVLRYI